MSDTTKVAVHILHDSVELAADPSWHNWRDHTHEDMGMDDVPVSHEHITIKGERTGPPDLD